MMWENNAFKTLKVTTFANRDEITEAYETICFDMDPALAEEAQAKLFNAKQRLHEFLRWYGDCPEEKQKDLLNGRTLDMNEYPLSNCNLLLSKINNQEEDCIVECVSKFDSTWTSFDEAKIEKLLITQQKSNLMRLPSPNDLKQEISEYKKECINYIVTILTGIEDTEYRQILDKILNIFNFADGIASDVIKRIFETYALQVKQQTDSILNDLRSALNQSKYSSLLNPDSTEFKKISKYFMILEPLQSFNEQCLISDIIYNPMISIIQEVVGKSIETGRSNAACNFIDNILRIDAVSKCSRIVTLLNKRLSNIRMTKQSAKIKEFLDEWVRLLNKYASYNDNTTSDQLFRFLKERVPQIEKDILSFPVSADFESCQQSNSIGDVFFILIRSFAIRVANEEKDYKMALNVLSILEHCYSGYGDSAWCYRMIQSDKETLKRNISIDINNKVTKSVENVRLGIGIIFWIAIIVGFFFMII